LRGGYGRGGGKKKKREGSATREECSSVSTPLHTWDQEGRGSRKRNHRPKPQEQDLLTITGGTFNVTPLNSEIKGGKQERT